MRLIARLEKRESVRFTSHLDVQRLIQRALRRADIPVAYSNGFNPHPLLSFATALPLGYTSSAEWLDIKLEREVACDAFVVKLNAVLPEGFFVLQCLQAADNDPTLAAQLSGTLHRVVLPGVTEECAAAAVEALMEAPIIVDKRGKAGVKQVDLRPMINEIFVEAMPGGVCLNINGRLDAAGGLNIELLMGALRAAGFIARYTVHRAALCFVPNGQPAPDVF